MRIHTRSLFAPVRGVLLVVLLACCSTTAWAHQINIDATVEGQTIRGRVYFRNNSPAQNITVRALDPEGIELGKTITDEQGKFTMPAGGRVEHRLVADTGDGHVTEPYALPAKLFQEAPPAASVEPDPAPPASVGRSPTPSASVGRSSTPSSNDNARIEQLNKQIDALQEELAECKSRLRVRDVLGGIGWLVGLAGTAYYYLGVRRKRV
jgi:nickel transport protein